MLEKTIAGLALLALAIPSTAMAEPAGKPATLSVAGPVDTFLASLKAGQAKQAVETLMSSSPLWSRHPEFSAQMIGQIDAATQSYGPVLAFEKVSSTNLGTMAVREYYLVQYRDMVTRWEFDLVRTGSGWNVGYFGFTDQPNAWFS